MKATLKTGWATIKTMDGSAFPTTTMQPGDYVYGDLSITKSDIINFTHFYRANGEVVPLVEGKLFKVTAGNMTITNETEPGIPPVEPPSPPPDPEGVKRIIDSVITYENNAGQIVTVKLIPVP